MSDELKYATRAMELLGKIAEIDLEFRLGKINAEESWKRTHKILTKENDLNE